MSFHPQSRPHAPEWTSPQASLLVTMQEQSAKDCIDKNESFVMSLSILNKGHATLDCYKANLALKCCLSKDILWNFR